MQHLQDLIVHLIDQFGYLGLFVGMALGNIGAPIGSEVVLPAAGALVATGHLQSLWVTVAVSVVGELAGGTVGYAVGRYGGRPFVAKYGKYVRFHTDHLDHVDGFFARWGTFAIFICRFVPVVRGIVSIPAGIARMSLGPFYLWYFLGSLGFCGGLILLGHALGKHIDRITPLLHKGGLVTIVCAAVAAVVIIVVVRSSRRRA